MRGSALGGRQPDSNIFESSGQHQKSGDTAVPSRSSRETVILNKSSGVRITSDRQLDGVTFGHSVEDQLRRELTNTRTGHGLGVQVLPSGDRLSPEENASRLRMEQLVRGLDGQRISATDHRTIRVEEVLGRGSNPSKETIKAQFKEAVERMKRGEKVRFVIRAFAADVAKIARKYLDQIRQSNLSGLFLLRIDGLGSIRDKVSSIIGDIRSRKDNPYARRQELAREALSSRSVASEGEANGYPEIRETVEPRPSEPLKKVRSVGAQIGRFLARGLSRFRGGHQEDSSN